MEDLIGLLVLPCAFALILCVASFAFELGAAAIAFFLLIVFKVSRAVSTAWRHASVWERQRSHGRLRGAGGVVGSRTAGLVGGIAGAYAGLLVAALLLVGLITGVLLLCLLAHGGQ